MQSKSKEETFKYAIKKIIELSSEYKNFIVIHEDI
jgi:hypothetical protein